MTCDAVLYCTCNKFERYLTLYYMCIPFITFILRSFNHDKIVYNIKKNKVKDL